MIPESAIRAMVTKIHTTPGLEGCLIGLQDNRQCRVIGHPSCVTPNSENIAVVIEEVLVPEVNAPAPGKTRAMVSSADKERIRNGSKLWPELIGAGVNCGFAFAAGATAVGAALAEGPTGGLSTFVFVASWTSFVSGSIQCGNGAVRVGAILSDPDGTSLDFLDKNKSYVVRMSFVDLVAVGSTVATLPTTARELWEAFSRLCAFKQAHLSFESLRSMNQLERLRAVTSVFQQATRDGERLDEIAKLAKRANIAKRTLSRSSGISVNHASTLQRIIGQESIRQLHIAIRDTIMNVAPLGANASSQSLVGSASGSVNLVINILDAGMPVF